MQISMLSNEHLVSFQCLHVFLPLIISRLCRKTTEIREHIVFYDTYRFFFSHIFPIIYVLTVSGTLSSAFIRSCYNYLLGLKMYTTKWRVIEDKPRSCMVFGVWLTFERNAGRNAALSSGLENGHSKTLQ